MLLAELEVRHSRAVAPTRRVALGQYWLPTSPAPGYGGILLGAIVAAFLDDLDLELRDDFLELIDDLEEGQGVAQPRLRHRFQTDFVGLERSHHALHNDGDEVRFELDGRSRPVPQLLGAVYAVSQLLHADARPAAFAAIRKGARWAGDIDRHLVTYLSDVSTAPPPAWPRVATDERWALQVLGFGPDLRPDSDAVQRRFRNLIRAAHPDHGAAAAGAGQRILELTEARRILLA